MMDLRFVRDRAQRSGVLLAGLLCLPVAAPAQDDLTDVIAFRNHHPFLQIFGVPVFQSATLAAEGSLKYDFNIEITNHADQGLNANETFEVDGETYSMKLSLRHRLWQRIELGVDVPVISHQGGFLDNIIKEWHDVLSVSNSNRSGPKDQLNFLYESGGVTQYELTSSTFGLGDIQLTAAVPLKEASAQSPAAFTVRTSVKLPTGDEQDLHGSGALDFSAGLYASTKATLFNRPLGLTGFAGALLLGDGDILPDLQRSTVAFGGVAARLQAMERLGITIQVYAQDDYFDADIDKLGGSTFQLGIGLDWHMPRRGLSLSFAIAEDPLSDATPDIAMQFSVRSSNRRSAP